MIWTNNFILERLKSHQKMEFPKIKNLFKKDRTYCHQSSGSIFPNTLNHPPYNLPVQKSIISVANPPRPNYLYAIPVGSAQSKSHAKPQLDVGCSITGVNVPQRRTVAKNLKVGQKNTHYRHSLQLRHLQPPFHNDSSSSNGEHWLWIQDPQIWQERLGHGST